MVEKTPGVNSVCVCVCMYMCMLYTYIYICIYIYILYMYICHLKEISCFPTKKVSPRTSRKCLAYFSFFSLLEFPQELVTNNSSF